MYAASSQLLASRGVPASVGAIAGAWDEIEHRRRVDALIEGMGAGGARGRKRGV